MIGLKPDTHQQDLLLQCRNSIGEKGFYAPFLKLVRELRAAQIGLWDHEPDPPECLFIRNFNNPVFAEVAKSIYLSGWYKRDPLKDRLLKLAPNSVETVTFCNTIHTYAPDVLLAFSSILKKNNQLAGFSDRITVLSNQEGRQLILHLYYHRSEELDLNHPLLPGLIDVTVKHFATDPSHEPPPGDPLPPALENLSDRERQVCIGILSGKKAERIAADMQVATSTVVTYRRRAYEKLGISSRAALFDICSS
ncbi:LuxR C-terminal-related transcriptional regulator [uncultured Cohaesibacter sp.]|uniref:helix-turn-helix transcriptional regulator n=1 Tax=uncultured Cohaesibacter sp. TaxID=1002546 RepID=UPI0029C6FCB3|nr:LuxR C-terminal-related transcriptional regulator [uncultured Cohaesibacter sp.]